MDMPKIIISKGFSSLEKMTEFKYFTLIWSFLFSLDIFYIIVYKNNLINIFLTGDYKNFKIIYFFLFIALFTFLMTLFFPILRYMLKSIVLLIFNDVIIDKSKNHKYLFSMKEEAIKTKDTFLLSLVEKKEMENREHEIDLNISFSLGLLLIFDYLLSSNSIQSISSYFIGILEKLSGIQYFIYLCMVIIFIIVIVFWLYISIKPYQIEKIYLPDDK